MRSVTYAGQRFAVEIVSLVCPREEGLINRLPAAIAEEANLTMLSPVELPLGAEFLLDNADGDAFQVRVLGCASRPDGRFVVIGLVGRA